MKYARHTILTLALAALTLAAGCGEFGIGSFAIFDVSTQQGGMWSSSRAIATGSVFEVDVATQDNVTVDTSDAAVIEHLQGNRFRAVGAGEAELVARDDKGAEVDRLTYRVADVDRVELHNPGFLNLAYGTLTEGIAMRRHDRPRLTVMLYAGKERLQHAAVVDLVADASDRVQVERTSDSSFRLSAPTATTTTLHLTVAGRPDLTISQQVRSVDDDAIARVELPVKAWGEADEQGRQYALVWLHAFTADGLPILDPSARWQTLVKDVQLLPEHQDEPSPAALLKATPDLEVGIIVTIGATKWVRIVRVPHSESWPE